MTDRMEGRKDVYFGTSLDNVLYQLKNRSSLRICGGCTFLRDLPQVALVTRNIADLKHIEKRERYLELGSGVTLAAITELGERHTPPVLYQALHSVATPIIRNMATLGGNLCMEPVRGALFAPLLALDTLLEFRTSSDVVSVPMSQFTAVPEASVLTKVRIPLDEWDVSLFRRVGPSLLWDGNCASYVFLAGIQKETLVNLRIAFCGALCLRSRELEDRLIGTKLPLSPREIADVVEAAGERFDRQVELCASLPESVDFPLLRARFLGLLRNSLEYLT